MQQDYDSSASGIVMDSFEGISSQFTDVEILRSSETNIVAKAKRYGRWWLLKGLRKEKTHEAGYQQRLRKELEILMSLQHPSVATATSMENVGDLGQCIVMEYVDGITLKEWLQKKTARKSRRKIAREIAEAISYIHSKGIVHRDLKPENIMITHNGKNIKLIDFGLADTDSYAILKQPAGTPRYMSPEQKKEPEADVRNDIYSLGIIFDQMDLGYEYHYILNRCKKTIDERYQNVDGLLSDMWKAEHRRTHILIACTVLLLALFIGWAGMQMIKVSESKTRIENAIMTGEAEIDKAIKETGIEQHLDTISSLEHLNNDYFDRLIENDGGIGKYLENIQSEFTESEIEEIHHTLMMYYGLRQKEVMEHYEQMKREYDKSVMQGD